MRRRVKRVISDCRQCKNAIFDDIFGEWKCEVHKRRVSNKDKNCAHYEKGACKQSKGVENE